MSEIPEIEYQLVYRALRAVAARCDGAQEQDGVGFNGQDTHFGRRVASVPFEEWTDDVKQEAARVILTYKTQVLTYTGLDVWDLQVVRDAQGRGTNHAARDDARGYERQAQGADKLSLRKIDVVGDRLGIFYDKKDPDFGTLLEVCKALPGRTFDWDRKCNVVPPSEAIEDFVLTWDFPVTEAAAALLQAPRAEFFNVVLQDNGERVTIDTPYDADLVEAIKHLPGRAYVGGGINHADIHPAVAELVKAFGLKISPDARAACEHAEQALEAVAAAALTAGDRKTLLGHVSRLGSPDKLPAAFLNLLEGVLQ